MNRIEEAAQLLRGKSVHFFTGAGMSAESGLEVYRNDDTGLWENVDPTAMASIDAWAKDPEPMWAWYLWRAAVAQRAEPNAGHWAIGSWPGKVWVTTQNIDNLHERGGAQATHLHGSLFEFRCSICSRPYKAVELPEAPSERLTPPSCPLCGNPVRPGVVWFGEPLPQREWAEAEAHMEACDALVIVGTSGTVQPAASLPLIAARRGVPIVEISPAATTLSSLATLRLRTTAAVGLPLLLDAL